jgi:hypothetical protein
VNEQNGRAVASVETSYVIQRADGTVIDLGTTGYWHRNPLKLWWWRACHEFAADRRMRAANRDAAKRAASNAEEAP